MDGRQYTALASLRDLEIELRPPRSSSSSAAVNPVHGYDQSAADNKEHVGEDPYRMDPFHDRFNLFRNERQHYGPCDSCATRYCMTHGEYLDYRRTNQCPACLEEAQRVMCPNRQDRECFYPGKCQESGCYFVNRDQQRLREQQEWERQQQDIREQQQRRAQQESEQRRQQWAQFNDWFRNQRTQ